MTVVYPLVEPSISKIIDLVSDRYSGNVQTAAKQTGEAQRLFRYLTARGVVHWNDVTSEVVLDWCWAARPLPGGGFARPRQSTARNRQWAAMAVFEAAETLGLVTAGRRLTGERIARSSQFVPARPLTDAEAERVRSFADRGQLFSRRAAIVALAFAGGTSAEIANVRPRHVDLPYRAVLLGGRRNPLGEWEHHTLGSFLRVRPPNSRGSLLAVSDRIEPGRRAHAVTVRLGAVISDAGLKGTPGVSARSVRLYTAHHILTSLGLEAAACFLGADSLTSVIQALAYDWKQAGTQQLEAFLETDRG